MVSDTINISKKKTYMLLAGILIIGLLGVAYALAFLPAQEEREFNEGVNDYRKRLYDSTVCQYSCPLVEKDFLGKQQLVPEETCFNECVLTYKPENFEEEPYTNEKLLDDGMIGDIEYIVLNCRDENLDLEDELDTESFFDCSLDRFEGLRDKYDYLT